MDVEHVTTSQPFAALRGETSNDTLYFYEQTKQAVGFDPETDGPQIPVFEPWNLYQPLAAEQEEMVSDLVTRFTLTPEQFLALHWLANCGNDKEFIIRVAEVMAEINTKERSSTGDQVPQVTETVEHTQSGPSLTGDRDDPERPGKVGKGRAHRNNKGGKTQPVSS